MLNPSTGSFGSQAITHSKGDSLGCFQGYNLMWKLQQKVQGVLYMVHTCGAVAGSCGVFALKNQVTCPGRHVFARFLASPWITFRTRIVRPLSPFSPATASKSLRSPNHQKVDTSFSDPSSNQAQRSHRLAMAAANEVARVMAEAAAMVQETWKDMAGGLGAWGTVLESWREMIKWGRNQ